MLVALLAPLLAPYDPLQTGLAAPLSGFSAAHPLGTDALGRDVLSRLIWGARISFTVSVLSVLGGTGLGVVLGVAGGHIGGWFDLLTQRLVDSLLAIPTLVLALALSATIGGSMIGLAIVVAVTLIPLTARVIRADAWWCASCSMSTRRARSGCSEARVLVDICCPSVLPNVIVLATIDLGVVMILEASLSFLGLGIPAPSPLGPDAERRGHASISARRRCWRSCPAGISIAVLGVNLAGDSLRNLLDPRHRGRRD